MYIEMGFSFTFQVAAKDQMLHAKEEAIKKLRSLTPEAAAADEERMRALEISAAESERVVAQLKSTISFLEQENNALSATEAENQPKEAYFPLFILNFHSLS